MPGARRLHLQDEPPSLLFANNLDVLRFVPGGCDPHAPAILFSSSRWAFSVALDTWPAYAMVDISWEGIKNPAWRVTAKEVALCLMQPAVAISKRLSGVRRAAYPPWAVPFQLVSYWRRFFAFITDERHTSLATLSQATLDSYLETITPDSRHIAVRAIRALASFGPVVSHDPWPPHLVPWGTMSAVQAGGEGGIGDARKRTPYIPDRVLAPLLAASLWLVDRADKEPNLAAAPRRYSRPHRGGPPADYDERLRTYLADRRRMKTGLPLLRSTTRSHPISLRSVAASIGMSDTSHLLHDHRWQLLADAADELGYTIEIDPTNSSRSPMAMNGLVRTACYIVVAALSGMRFSELAEVRRGATKVETCNDGVVRYRVESRLLKGERPGGRHETWTVVEPVEQALRVAESLTPDLHPLRTPVQTETKALREWVTKLGPHLGLAPIPDDWHLEPRQFRRTLARELGWRPNGVIAGKIHLKHVSVAVTEGYAGRRGESAESFLTEVEKHRRGASKREARSVLDSINNGDLVIGLGAPSLLAAVEELGDTVGRPQVRDREEAVNALLSDDNDAMHQMPLCYCWFRDPRKARCLRDVEDKSRPIANLCRPTECVQATIHPTHVPVWLAGIDSLRKSANNPHMPTGERDRIRAQIQSDEEAIRPFMEERS